MAETRGIERNPGDMSAHQIRVEEFMKQGGQLPPDRATMPDFDTRHLRAKLTIEEAIEKVNALGFTLSFRGCEFTSKEVGLCDRLIPNLEGIVDGCADLSVVLTGTLSMCGVADLPILREVDRSNLTKFREGWHRRADGKIVKSPLYEPAKYAVVEAFKAQGQ